MLTFLGEILTGILELPYTLINLVIDFFNAIILAIATLAELLLSLLPAFPEAPSPPGGIAGAVLWFLPLVQVLAIWTTMITLWLTFLAIKVALKWVKLL